MRSGAARLERVPPAPALTRRRPSPAPQVVAAAIPAALKAAPNAKMFLRSFWYRATLKEVVAGDEMHIYTVARCAGRSAGARVSAGSEALPLFNHTTGEKLWSSAAANHRPRPRPSPPAAAASCCS